MDFKNEYLSRKKRIDEAIEKYLQFQNTVPLNLKNAMGYPIYAGGKRIRPILCISTFELCGGKEEKYILSPACALELIHSFTLVHDDLPALDNDDLRRGKPTLHRAFNEALAILAGDALFIYSIEVFLKSSASFSLKERALRILIDSLGPRGVIGGQVMDIESQGKEPSVSSLNEIHSLKTASFISASCQIGAILSGKEEKLDTIKEIGNKIGCAFQIVDDILDATGDEQEIGKRVRKDADKMTSVKVYGVEKSRKLAQNLVNSARELLYQFPEGHKRDFLDELFGFILNRRW